MEHPWSQEKINGHHWTSVEAILHAQLQGPQAPPGFQPSTADAAAPPAGSSLGIQGREMR